MSRSELPYTDTKSTGAADFYYVINATFRFVEARLGPAGLLRYWRDLGSRYYAPVSAAWARGGLPAVAAYWREFFAAEPGGDVQVRESPERVLLEVRTCPALKHLRAGRRAIVPAYCQHCYFVSEAVGAPAGIAVRVQGGNGNCRQVFLRQAPELPPQDLGQIREVV